MGLYGFKKQFEPFIMDGRKTHTIRGERAHPDKPGNTMHLYTGLRTKSAKLLMRVPCVKVEAVMICKHQYPDSDDATNLFEVSVDGVGLERDEKENLARRDGFRDFAEMMAFWEGRIPFVGHIVHWKFTKAKAE